jgi:A/G-specific adenine glycosylase
MTSGSSDYARLRRALRRAEGSLKRDLPWIGHRDPWAVLVSEFMLQQTQVSRVIGPWTEFLKSFPTPTACAQAPLSQVMRLWAGLGYHRRAKALHDAAQMIRNEFGGVLPSDVEQLRRLPGVGEYTANAVASFSFARPVAVLDTNVGRILARALANRALDKREANAMANQLLGRSASAAFNQSMLDLGAQYCRAVPRCQSCPVARACRWNLEGGVDPAPHSAAVSRAQSRFVGSDRQLRGRVLKHLRSGGLSKQTLFRQLEGADVDKCEVVLHGLVVDGLVQRRGRMVQLSGD